MREEQTFRSAPVMKIRKKHVDLSAVSYYLKRGQYPDGLSDSDKRCVRKRSKDFRLHDGVLYFVRDPKNNPNTSGESDSERPPPPPDAPWRRVLLRADHIRNAFLECHVDAEGSHRTYDKTLKEFTDSYYLAKTIETIRNYMRECPVCQAFRVGSACGSSTPKTSSEREEHVAELMAALPFPNFLIEPVTHFWQKVEIDMIGPFKVHNQSGFYAIVCLDMYSLWPEATVMEFQTDVSPVANIIHFVLNLVCRFGVMETLIFRREFISRKEIDGRLDLLTDADHSVDIEFGLSQETVHIWNTLTEDIKSFVETNPHDWSKCIEICLLSHRISRPEQAEYTPAFLLHNREPQFPESISHREPGSELDIHFTDDQKQSTLNRMMQVYRLYSESQNHQCKSGQPMVVYVAPGQKIPQVKITKLTMSAEDAATYKNTDEIPSSSKVEMCVIPAQPPLEEGGVRIAIPSLIAAAADKLLVTDSSTSEKHSVSTSEPAETAASAENKSPERVEETEKVVTRGRKRVYSNLLARMSAGPKESGQGKRKKRENRDVPLDEYYQALKLYVHKKKYPPGIKDDYKRVIRKMAQNYVIEKDVLYYKSGKKLKKIVMDERERFLLLKQAHINSTGVHMGRLKTLDRLSDYYWKGLTMDSAAFVKVCPDCDHGSERRRSSDEAHPGLKSFLNLVKEAEAEESAMKEETQEKLYEAIKLFLTTGNKPSAFTSEESDYIDREAKKFRVQGNKLWFTENTGSGKLRKVLLTSEDKQAALIDAHVLKTGIHRGIERTKEMLRSSYYWAGMNTDLKEYLDKCCVARVMPETKKVKSQEDKMAKFIDFFKQEIIFEDNKDNFKHPSPDVNEEEVADVNDMRQENIDETLEVGKDKTTDEKSDKDDDNEMDDRGQKAKKNHSAKDIRAVATCSGDSCKVLVKSSARLKDCSTSTEQNSHNVTKKKDAVTQLSYSDDLSPGSSDLVRSKDNTGDTENAQSKDMLAVSSDDDNSAEKVIKGKKGVLPCGSSSESGCTASERNSATEEAANLPVKISTMGDKAAESTGLVTDKAKASAATATADKDTAGIVLTEVQDVEATDLVLKEVKEELLQDENSNKQEFLMDVKPVITPHVSLKAKKSRRGKRRRELVCFVCGAKCGGPVSLQIHMSTHSGLKPFSCDVCGKRFTERKYVRIHMRRHTGEKPYLCSTCGKGFPRAQSLQAHMIIHEKGGAQPRKCEVCDRPFASESRLRSHMEAKHPAVPKVYKCAECNRVFTAMRSLKRHIEAHMGLKRYECPQCGRRFLRKEYLRSHSLQHSGDLPVTRRKKQAATIQAPPLKITVGSNTYSVFTTDSGNAATDGQEKWVTAELVTSEQITDNNQTSEVQQVDSMEQCVEAPLFFIAPNQVEYEVECTSSGSTELTEADLTAINILAQATLSNSNTLA